ncbi:uncharacterized protein Z519_01618 [Cladophialophora bantiana CBS 173.52]|uniref:rRNA processing protein n=1 Tax=Cladophialophora bantiana (strain ATCC 10958 / CBS 173.52 / CDC B-1940 / NIH 8579) TaxID=1442370 RepID=A0A0D2IMR4_CLAB1|nr:uncharacterized protein Z519_01618 [Cladophialophora bantiana CBS 173.52]KIW98034.1 hypothetical protein Z519_01618 [Cladophialophora bantiana CBS 173.52]
MAKKSKLLAALDAHRGRDYQAEKRKAQVKAAEKRKRQKLEAAKHEDNEQELTSGEEAIAVGEAKQDKGQPPHQDDFAQFAEEDSRADNEAHSDDRNGATVNASNGDSAPTIPQPAQPIDASASEAENESDVPVSDLENSDLEDTVPYQKMTINNGPALLASCKRISLIKAPQSTPFHYHNSLVSDLPPTSQSVPDPNDDLTRELEFYRIARTAVIAARDLLLSEKVAFSRPADYFAEMVKSDEHMGRVKQKMYDEAANKKAAEEARKLRDAKKFGKAVQVAKEQERAREKRNTLEKIKELKRKRKGADTGKVTEGNLDDDLFQSIDVEKPATKDRAGRDRGLGSGPNPKRQKRDQKYGFGGKKRHAKSGDAISSGDMRGFSTARMKGKGGKVKAKRLGKSKRMAAR